MINKKISTNPLKDSIDDLKLFQQTNYCFNYIKEKNPNASENEIFNSAEISSACFRQANQFLISANNANLSTNPLLYSYALNNFTKGMGYLLFLDSDMLQHFKKHGFSVQDKNISNNILSSKITVEQKGVTAFILKLFNNKVFANENISFELLLSQIPEISDIFTKTTLKMSNVAKKVPNETNSYISICQNFNCIKEKENIFNEYGIRGTYIKTHLKMCFNMKGIQKFKESNTINNNLFYLEYLILPNKFSDGIYDINLMFYCYLLIMGYGMLVRYNAHKWEKFIDPQVSNESTLITISVDACIKHFLVLLHQKLFGYIYVERQYNDFDIKDVIKESTIQIMNDITSKISSYNLIYNEKNPLPWPKEMK